MITQKEAFRRMLRNKYPNHNRIAIDAMHAFVVDKPLDPKEAYLYYQTEIKGGRYIVFYGLTAEQVQENIDAAINGDIPLATRQQTGGEDVKAPSTYQNFEAWLERKGIKPTMRVYKSRSTALSLLNPMQRQDVVIEGCRATEEVRNWYVYEFKPPMQGYNAYFPHLPHAVIVNKDGSETLYVLAKAPTTTYRYESKKAKILKTFETVQPVEQQLTVALSTGDDAEAMRLYNIIQQTITESTAEYTVDCNMLREAMNKGTLHIMIMSGKGRKEKQTDAESEEDF